MAFLYVNGSMPVGVDHKNQIKADNRWRNLRESNQSINAKNMPMNKANTSGINGVSWNKVRRKWVAQISIDGKQFNLGGFNSKKDAATARLNANRANGFTAIHGAPNES